MDSQKVPKTPRKRGKSHHHHHHTVLTRVGTELTATFSIEDLCLPACIVTDSAHCGTECETPQRTISLPLTCKARIGSRAVYGIYTDVSHGAGKWAKLLRMSAV